MATVCLVASTAVSHHVNAQASNEKLIAAVDAVVEAARSARSIPGVSVVITRGNEVLLAKGYGFADIESGLRAAADTVFQIGSISKQFTAAAVMRLVEMGRCSLDDGHFNAGAQRIHAAYGFALSLLELSSEHQKVSHHGAMLGFTGMLSRYPKQDTIVAVLTNRGGLWADGMEEAIARKVFGLPNPRSHNVVVSKAEQARYVGNYDVGSLSVRITAEPDGRLWLRTPRPGPTAPLLFHGENRFVSTDDPDAISVTFECSTLTCNRIRFRMAGMIWYGERIDLRPI